MTPIAKAGDASLRAANSAILLIVSRFVLAGLVPVIIPLIGFLAWRYLDQSFQEVRTVAVQAAATASKANDNAVMLNDQVLVIRANMNDNNNDRLAFERQITPKVDKIADAVTTTSIAVSAIAGALQAEHPGIGLASPRCC